MREPERSAAIESLFLGAKPLAYRWWRTTNSRADFSDVLGTMALVVIELVDSWNGHGSLQGYVMSLVYRRLVDQFRGGYLRPSGGYSRTFRAPIIEFDGMEIANPARDEVASGVLLARQFASSLSLRERRILVSRLRGCTMQDTADSMGISLGRVSQLNTRVQRKWSEATETRNERAA